MNASILKSWKEVAEYLKVSVRTAQRWKHEFGLPVHRMEGEHASGILAFPDEIEQWLTTRLKKAGGDPASLAQEEPGVELEDVLITDQLWRRPWRPPMYEREFEALRMLVRSMVRQEPTDTLRTVSQCALDLCRAESAGFSILESDETGFELFRVVGTRGAAEKLEGVTSPRHFNPCGVCLERNAPQLFSYPERHYPYLRAVAPLSEVLKVPMYGAVEWIGVICVVSHGQWRKFDREDVRILESLAGIASAVLTGKPLNESLKKPEEPKVQPKVQKKAAGSGF